MSKSIVRIEFDLNELSDLEVSLHEMRRGLKNEKRLATDGRTINHLNSNISDISRLLMKVKDGILRFERKYGR